MKTNEKPIILEREFPCSVTRLWSALVEPAEMRQWSFDNIPDFRPEEGFETEFLVDAGERKFLHQWQVTEVIPEKKLAYRWRYEGYEGSAQSVFVLTGDDSKCQLRFSFPIEQSFSAKVPEFTRDACLQGWRYLLQELRSYLDS